MKVKFKGDENFEIICIRRKIRDSLRLLEKQKKYLVIDNIVNPMKLLFLLFCDVPEAWQVGFQDPATPVMEGLVVFHNDLMYFIIFISIFIFYFIGRIVFIFKQTELSPGPALNKTHDTILEII